RGVVPGGGHLDAGPRAHRVPATADLGVQRHRVSSRSGDRCQSGAVAVGSGIFGELGLILEDPALGPAVGADHPDALIERSVDTGPRATEQLPELLLGPRLAEVSVPRHLLRHGDQTPFPGRATRRDQDENHGGEIQHPTIVAPHVPRAKVRAHRRSRSAGFTAEFGALTMMISGSGFAQSVNPTRKWISCPSATPTSS